jgi:hypothetical protein
LPSGAAAEAPGAATAASASTAMSAHPARLITLATDPSYLFAHVLRLAWRDRGGGRALGALDLPRSGGEAVGVS